MVKKMSLLVVLILASVSVTSAQGGKGSGPTQVEVVNPSLAVRADYEAVSVCSAVYNPTTAYVVPADKRLVIEDATVSANLDSDEVVVGLIETTSGLVSGEHYVGRISGAFFRFDRDGRVMRVHGDPGTPVVFKVARRNSPDSMEICFSGRLEDVQ